jgi:GTP-binding protein EngB required for normal cell division
MKLQDVSTEAQEIRQTLAGLTQELGGLQADWALAPFPNGFQRAMTALGNPEYDVVVCGEVKRGKSTFINALIGRAIVPTGVRETTSQVFRIAHAEQESFALVFEDGCREPISAEGLAAYGSQTAAELDGLPLFRGRVLRWIEVNTPTAFLPDGVHLVDTPGLGALYASHSDITNRYILRADAVIFVLDSDQPITHSEKRFLEKALDITPNALFIQTKIDTKNEAAWQTILHRNEELLNEAFHKQGRPRLQVYPVSSTLLFKAAQEKDAQERTYLVDDSLFIQARAALDRVIYKAVGWTRSAWAAAEAAKYIHAVGLHLGEQREIVTATTLADKAAIRQRKSDIRLQFQKEWGAGGTKCAQFAAEVERILRGVRQSAYNIGTPGSELYARILNEINHLVDRHGLEQYVNELPRRVQEGVEQEWRDIVLSAQRQISALDEHFSMAVDGQAAFKVDLPRIALRDPSVWDRVKAVNIDGMIAAGWRRLWPTCF